MTNQINQKISQYLDGDLDRSDAVQLLKTLQQDEQLQTKLQRYIVAQQALKSTPVMMAESDFLSKVRQELEHEPIHFQAKPRAVKPAHKTPIWALAASVAALAVIVPAWMKATVVNPNASMLMVQEQPKTTSESSERVRVYPVNQRFQDYLQAHNGSLYTNGAAKLQGQTQLASYDQK